MNTIKLGTEVIVSDPCYEIPTWCQAVVENVLPGDYVVEVDKSNQGDWGIRVATLKATHKDYLDGDFSLNEFPAEIGVDSGQAGIFSKETYRKDGVFDGQESEFGKKYTPWKDDGGEKWYSHMCDRTLGENQWGTYPEGVVSTSGIGDGSYQLSVGKNLEGKVVAFEIDFGLGEDYDDDEGNEEARWDDDELDPAGGYGLKSHE